MRWTRLTLLSVLTLHVTQGCLENKSSRGPQLYKPIRPLHHRLDRHGRPQYAMLPATPRCRVSFSCASLRIKADLFRICRIAPRTCVSPRLYAAFDDISKVRPIRERRVFSSFKAGFWGTGITTRQKVVCRRTPGVQALAKLPNIKFKSSQTLTTIYGSYGKYRSYTDVIGDSIFCPQPPGTTG